MEEKELIELYIQRNNLAKSSNMEEANKITEDINNKLPTKLSKRGFKDSDGNVVEFEIIGCADADIVPNGWNGMSENFITTYYNQGNTGSYKEGNRLACYIHNGKAKVPFKRILIRRKSFN